MAESFERGVLESCLRSLFPADTIKSFPDVFHVNVRAGHGMAAHDAGGDVFFFDWVRTLHRLCHPCTFRLCHQRIVVHAALTAPLETLHKQNKEFQSSFQRHCLWKPCTHIRLMLRRAAWPSGASARRRK